MHWNMNFPSEWIGRTLELKIYSCILLDTFLSDVKHKYLSLYFQ